MAFDRDTLETIYDAAGGACHRCHRPLELGDYGRRGEPDAWEIDATRPHPKSTVLRPACVACLRPAAAADPPRRRERSARDLAFGTPLPPILVGYARARGI